MQELYDKRPVCVALGFFDSVHLGHRTVIAKAAECAKKYGIESAIFTFSNNAYKQFNSDGKLVYTYQERLTLLEGLCDFVIPFRFNSVFKELTADEFLQKGIEKYGIKCAVCGYDYLFGAGAQGDAAYLKAFADRCGIDCEIVDKYAFGDERISTTRIKELLMQGEIVRANEFLGSPFFMDATVVKGRGAGRMFNIPTANLGISRDKIKPKEGVYATRTVVDGKSYVSATNVGTRPTFGLHRSVVESMLADFSDNLYGKSVRLYFLKRLRDIEKFETPALLSKQVHDDLAASAQVEFSL